jgi:exopolysaccharide biosynthesis polyprenyl glycosylphosphotransferase
MALLEASAPRVARRSLALRWVFPAVSFVVDLILINLAFAVAYVLRYKFGIGGHVLGQNNVRYEYWLHFEILLTVLMAASFALAGTYRQRLGMEWLGEVFAVGRAATVGMALAIIVTYLSKNLIDEHSRLVLLYTWILIIALASLGRGLTRLILRRLHRRGWNVRRVVVAGSTAMSKMVMQNLSMRLDQGYQLVGFLHENGAAPEGFGRFRNLGSVASAPEVIARHEVDEVVIALGATSHEDILSIRDHCLRQNVAFKFVPDLFEMSLSRVRMDDIAGIPLIDVTESPLHGVNFVAKRLLDSVVSLAALVVLSPVLILVALAIRLDSPGPIMIAQERVGRGGRVFPCFKFRSMYQDAEQRHAEMQARYGDGTLMFKHKNDPRRTRVGRVIRKLSIDELPNLFNVVRGEMSLVGPRPALPIEVAGYEPWHRKRFEVQPGMTGLWQISGRSHLDFHEMVIMDIYYIDNWSLALDLKILLRTPAAVLTMRGAY